MARFTYLPIKPTFGFGLAYSGNGVGHNSKVLYVETEMGDRSIGIPSCYVTSHPGQPSLTPSAGRMSTGQGAVAVLCGLDGKHVSCVALAQTLWCIHSNYGITGLKNGDEHPAYTPALSTSYSSLLKTDRRRMPYAEWSGASCLSAMTSASCL